MHLSFARYKTKVNNSIKLWRNNLISADVQQAQRKYFLPLVWAVERLFNADQSFSRSD